MRRETKQLLCAVILMAGLSYGQTTTENNAGRMALPNREPGKLPIQGSEEDPHAISSEAQAAVGSPGPSLVAVPLDHAENIAVHNEGEDAEQEDESHLHEALLERHAQVAAQQTFDR
jgi:hypothetical protein